MSHRNHLRAVSGRLHTVVLTAIVWASLLLAEAADMFRRAHALEPERDDIRQALAAALTDLGDLSSPPPPQPQLSVPPPMQIHHSSLCR